MASGGGGSPCRGGEGQTLRAHPPALPPPSSHCSHSALPGLCSPPCFEADCKLHLLISLVTVASFNHRRVSHPPPPPLPPRRPFSLLAHEVTSLRRRWIRRSRRLLDNQQRRRRVIVFCGYRLRFSRLEESEWPVSRGGETSFILLNVQR